MLKRVLCVLTSIALVLAMMPSVVATSSSSTSTGSSTTSSWVAYTNNGMTSEGYYSYTFSWSEVSDASYYIVTINGESYIAASTSYTVSTLENGKTYIVYVTAYDSDDSSTGTVGMATFTVGTSSSSSSSSSSSTSTSTTGTNCTVTSYASYKTVTWNAYDGADYYIVTYFADASSTGTSLTTTSTSISLPIPNTSDVTIYVTAYDSQGIALGMIATANVEASSSSSSSATTSYVAYTLVSTSGTLNGYNFSWSEVSGAKSYKISYSSSNGTTGYAIATSNSYFAYLTAGYTYTITVYAYSEENATGSSSAVGVATLVASSSSSSSGNDETEDEDNCKIVGITSDGLVRYSVSWETYTGATYYQVTAYEATGLTLVATSEYTSSLETTIDLEDGNSYLIYVSGYNPAYNYMGSAAYYEETVDLSETQSAVYTFEIPQYLFFGYLTSGDVLTLALPSTFSTDSEILLPVEYTLTYDGVTVKLMGSDGSGAGVYEQDVLVSTFAKDYDSATGSSAQLIQQTVVSASSDMVITATVDCSGYDVAPVMTIQELKAAYADSMRVTYTENSSSSVCYLYNADITKSYISLYTITTSSATGGTLTTDLVSAASGLTVTVEASAESGYELSGVTVTDADGASVEVADCGDGTYTFTMPSSAVTVSADVSHAHSLTKTDAVDETCLTDGNIEYWYCSVCGNYYSDEDCTTEIALEDTVIGATGHDYEAVVTEPTCTEGGYTTYTCSNCGDSYVADETEATGHSYEAVVTEPTCTEGGYTTRTCSTCGDTYTDSETEALGHDYESEVTTEATCTEAGVKTYTCTRCGDTYTEEIPATGHNYVATETTATCTEGGYTTCVCAECGDTYTDEETEALGHDYESVVTKEPTCTETGVMTYTCSRCGDSYTEEIDMIDHTYGEPEWTWTWSETEQTYTVTAKFTCTVCGGTDTETALVTSETTDATCTATGSTVYTAVVDMDGTAYSDTKTVELPMIPHTEGEAVTENEVAATCTTDGSYDTVVYCTVCGEELSKETVTVPATGHTEGEAVTENEVAAICTTDGSYDTVIYCTVCNEELSRETVTVPATGHTEGEAVTENEVAATCTTDGSYDTVVYCSVCGEELSRETITVPATGHTEGEAVTENEVAATCTTDGSYDTVVYCSVCGEELSRETVTVPATGHTTEIRNAVDATCTEDGYTGDEVCTVCGETITVGTVIPATGHSFNSEGVCEACGAKTGESGTTSTVTVESDDTIFANVLPSGLVTSVEVTVSNTDGGTLVVSTVVEVSAYPYLVEHIADTLSFALYNEAQGDDLISDTNSFTITTTENNKKTLKKVTILFYGDVDYSGTGTSTVTMDFASASDLSSSDIYVLHYTGSYPTWEVVASTVTFGESITVEFEASDYSPFVVLSVASASSGGSSSALDILLRISANYSEVNEAITRANALNPADYVDFSAVTEAINAVNWNLKAINQLTVNAYADAINTAIDSLVKTTATITEETVNIDEPIEDTNSDTEADVF